MFTVSQLTFSEYLAAQHAGPCCAIIFGIKLLSQAVKVSEVVGQVCMEYDGFACPDGDSDAASNEVLSIAKHVVQNHPAYTRKPPWQLIYHVLGAQNPEAHPHTAVLQQIIAELPKREIEANKLAQVLRCYDVAWRNLIMVKDHRPIRVWPIVQSDEFSHYVAVLQGTSQETLGIGKMPDKVRLVRKRKRQL